MKLENFSKQSSITPKRTQGLRIQSRIALFFHTADLRSLVKSFSLSIAATTTILFSTVVTANPQEGVVAAGSADIIAEGQKTTILQHSNRAVINWKDFSIAEGEHTQFVQPNSNSIAVNRVTGGSVSEIYGKLTANGRVWILNPNGIYFGPSSYVNVSGVMASTLDLHNQNDFMSGLNHVQFKPFSGDDYEASISSSVVNKGTIVSESGLAALVAPGVANYGVIRANLGNVVLGSGTQYTMDFYGDGLINFVIDKGLLVRPTAYDDSMDSLIDTMVAIDQRGDVIAEGGSILIQTGSAVDVLDNIINLSGNMRATSYEEVAGHIGVYGNSSTVNISGFLDAVGNDAGEAGGSVHVFAQFIDVEDSASIDVSGQSGGGSILLGGDRQGSGEYQTAQRTVVESGATLKADSHVTGDAGTIVAWADKETQFHGTASASALGFIGAGGFVETSGKETLDISGASVTASSVSGEGGSWLLDPTDFFVDGSNSTSISDSLDLGTDVIIQTLSTGTEDGDVTFASAAAISWGNADSDLFVYAHNDIIFELGALIEATQASNITLRADSDSSNRVDSSALAGGNAAVAGGTVMFNDVDQVKTLGDVDIFYGTTDFTAATDYSSNVDATNENAYMLINDVYDLQQMSTALDGHYALGKDIDASATSTWDSDKGFDPVGDNAASFKGVLEGDSNTISDLTINRNNEDYVGLFGFVQGADSEIKNVNLDGGTIVGKTNVGSIAGAIQQTKITNVSSSASVEGYDENIGGLVGLATYFETPVINGATISESTATGTVSGNVAAGNQVGGIVGALDGSFVTKSNATGNVSGNKSVGGLAGFIDNDAVVSESYASGDVTGNNGALSGEEHGGLVGSNYATIENSFATGNVEGDDSIGGLVGENNSTIQNAYATGDVDGYNSVGGLVGLHGSAPSDDISNTYTTGTTTGNTAVGQLIGKVQNTATVSNSFSLDNTTDDVIGDDTNAGAITDVALRFLAEMRDPDTFAAWDFSTNGIPDDAIDDGDWIMAGFPQLQMQLKLMQTGVNTYEIDTIEDLQMMAVDLDGDYSLIDNVDATETHFWNPGVSFNAGFASLGNDERAFTGSFDGQGYAVDSLYINQGGVDNVGLLGVTRNAIISNLGLTNALVVGGENVGRLVGLATEDLSANNLFVTGDVIGVNNVGGLIGLISGDTTLSNSYSEGSVEGVNNVGGLVGQVNANADIDEVYSTSRTWGSDNVGGLLGFVNTSGFNFTLDNAYTQGNVIGENAVGGLIGSLYQGEITNVYTTGLIVGSNNTGGIIGEIVNADVDDIVSITHAYYDTDTAFVDDAIGALLFEVFSLNTTADLDARLFEGNNQSRTYTDTTGESSITLTNVSGKTTTELQTQSTFTTAGWDFSNNRTGVDGQWYMLRSNAYPVLQIQHTNNIRTLTQLQLVNIDLTADYQLMNSIDAGATSIWNGGLGFKPIGDSASADFSGSFDGQFYTINDLVVNKGIDSDVFANYYAGLFGKTSNATVKNVGLVGGDIAGYSNVGGLIGLAVDSIIENTYSSAMVRGQLGSLGGSHGGLVGSNNANISNSYSTGDILSGGIHAGGLVGVNNASGVITDSYATGDILGYNFVGGLVGRNYGSISNAFSTGDVTGTLNVGGLSGELATGDISVAYATGHVRSYSGAVGGFLGQISGGIIDQVYSVGAVTGGGANGGGLIGSSVGGTVTGSFWDVDTSGKASSAGGAGVIGKSTADMQTQKTYTDVDWDFTNNNVGVEGDWYMAGSARYPRLQMENTLAQTFGIKNVNELQMIDVDLTGNYFLANNIDASETVHWNPESATDYYGFSPIALITDSDPDFDIVFDGTPFTGSLDGRGYTVSNLWFDRNNQSFVGLFAKTSGATISNLGVTDSSYIGEFYVGSLVASSDNRTRVHNVFVDENYVQGLNFVGGVLGEQADSWLSNAYADSTVFGFTNSGGLVGENRRAMILNAHSSGKVYMALIGGGIVGSNSDSSTVMNAYTKSDVFGGLDLFGDINYTSTPSTGGIAGINDDSIIINTYARGKVLGLGDVGGLVGTDNAGTVTNSYWDIATTGQTSSAGGGTGYFTAQMQTEGTYAGWSFLNNSTGVYGDWIMVKEDDYPHLQIENTMAKIFGIQNVTQLQLINVDTTGEYTLRNNIDASETAGWNNGEGFNPINNLLNEGFDGTLDGQNYTISNLSITRPSESEIGLFSRLDNGGVVKNVGLIDPTIIGNTYVGGLSGYFSPTTLRTDGLIQNSYVSGGTIGLAGVSTNVGGLVGSMREGRIIDSWSSADIVGVSDLGGVVGYMLGGSTVFDNVYSTGSVTATNSNGRVGGLVGYLYSLDNRPMMLNRVFSTGDVQNDSLLYGTGGLVGAINPALLTSTQAHIVIQDSYTTANVRGGGGNTGGMIGVVDWNANDATRLSIIDSYSAGNVTSLIHDENSSTAGLIGHIAQNATVDFNNVLWDVESSGFYAPIGFNEGIVIGSPIGITSVERADESTFSNLGWGFNNNNRGIEDTWVYLGDEDGQLTPVLQSALSYNIAEAEQLRYVTLDMQGDYVLTRDIDASDTEYWNSGAGFNPIGNDSTKFTGQLDGRGFAVRDLFINRSSTENVGMFGYIQNATIKNIGLIGGTIVGGNYTGGLVGQADVFSLITSAYNKGNVNGRNFVGGLAGLIDSGSTIENSYATDDVTGEFVVGGLVGSVFGGGIVKTSFATGDVTAASNGAGGLVGSIQVNGRVFNAYATGSVTGDNNVGGFAGSSEGGITNAYSEGFVTGAGSTGGFLGFWSAFDSNTNTYWNIQTSGQAGSAGAGVIGKTPNQMTQEATFTDWNFENSAFGLPGGEWIMAGTPHLQMEHTTDITNVNELALTVLDPFSDYVLMNDIDASQTEAWNYASGLYNGFTPIGLFAGSLDGQGFAIRDLFVRPTNTNLESIGLFSFVHLSDVSNLELINPVVTAPGVANNKVGALSGSVIASTIDNVGVINGTVYGIDRVGGLVGEATMSAISHSFATGTVSGDDVVGGLAGALRYKSSLAYVYSAATVMGDGGQVGGLVGAIESVDASNEMTVQNAYAIGDVFASSSYAGGLIGLVQNADIQEVYATGAVRGDSYVGGLFGELSGGSVSEGFATGRVTASSDAGGLFGLYLSGSSLDKLFWDEQSTKMTGAANGNNNSIAGTTGIELTAEMKDSAVLVGLDFADTWEWILPDSGTEYYDYPHLISENAYGIVSTAGNDGTTGDVVALLSDGLLTGFKGEFLTNDSYMITMREDRVPAGSHLLLFNDSSDSANVVMVTDGQELISSNGPLLLDTYMLAVSPPTAISKIIGIWAAPGDTFFISDIADAVGDYQGKGVRVEYSDDTLRFTNNTNLVTTEELVIDETFALDAHVNGGVYFLNDVSSKEFNTGLIFSGEGTATAEADVDLAYFELQDGTWDQQSIDPTAQTFYANDFRLTGGEFKRFLNSTTPFQIADVYGLQGLNTLSMTNDYTVVNNIDARVTESWNDGEGFMPIGSGGSAYQGIFNGGGHLIDGLTIHRPTENYVGLFSATTGATVEIQHIGLTNVDIIGNSNVGALVGDVNNVNPVAGASISNVFVEGRVQGMSDNVGGVIGVLGTDATIDQAYSLGSVIGGWQRTGGLIGVINSGTNNVTNSFSMSTVTGGIFGIAGGFAGDIKAGAKLSRVYAQGDVIGSNGSTNVGGFAGTYSGAMLDQAYSTGLVSGTGLNFAGFIGQNITGNITHSFWNTETSGYAIGVPPTNPQPGLNELVGLDTEGLMTQSVITSTPGNNWNFSTDWIMAGYPMLRAFNDTLVNNVIELQLMINDLSADYTLTADIDASDTVNWNAGAGFKPIGFTNGSEFIGQLDGNGYNISDLTINRPLEVSVGLFGKVAGNALAITNVNLVDIDIIANGFTGGLVGESSSNGTISDVSVSGTIDSAESWAGGLVGISNGNFNPTISNIYTDVDITGKFNLGGIAGTLSGTNATSGTTLKNVYSTGELTGLGQIGGIVGQNYIGVSIENSYSTSKINSTGSNVGAFIGFNGGNQVQNSFIDSSVNDVMNAIGGGTLGGVDKITTAELTNINTFTGWGSDFYENGGNTWIMAGLPHLQLELNLMRTSDNHFEIDDAVDLQLATLDLDGIYTLTQDIDASVTREWNCISSCTTGTPEYAGFEPIGSYNDRFLGTLDGQQHEIDGLYMKWDSGDFVALFEAVGEGALIKDLGLTSVHIEGGQRLAALAGYMTGASRVQNSYSTGNIYATNAAWAGGLIGIMQDDADSIIQNSYSTANVSGYAWSMGGLIGLFNSGKVFNSYTLGSVSNTAEVNSGFDTGGLTGIIGSQATIINSYAAGPITGNNAGGLMGSSQGFGGTVKNSFWDVDTTGQATSAAGTGLTHAEALTKSTYTNAGWDFTSIWQIPEGIDAPRLIAEGNLDAISGQVYDSSLSASAQNIGVVLGGGSSIARHTVSLSDGSYSFALSAREMENAAGDEVIIFVDNNTGFTANTLFRKEDDVDVTDLNLIQDTIIAGYENGTDVDMALLNDATKNYMSSSIGYTVSGSTLDTSSNAFIANNEYSTGSNETIISTSDRGIAFNDTLELSSGDITLDNNASTGNVYLNADILSTPADTYNLNIDAGPGAIVLDGNVIKPNDISFLANEAVIAGNLQLVNTTAFDFPLHFRGDTVFSSTSTGATALNFQEAISSDYSMLTLNMLIGKQILAGSTVDLDTFYLERGVWAQDLLNPTLQTFSARDFRLGDVDVAVFLRGNFNSFPNIFISDVYGLQGIGSTSLTLNPGANISLSENIDASGTEHWYDGAGFRPIGDSSNPYQGTFDGQDFSITGLTILTTNKNTGLFGYTDSASIHNVELMDADIDSTETYTGALIGQAVNGTTVTQVHSSGVVYGGNNTGGLIGDLNNSAVFESFSIADVYSTGDNVGGLVGVLGGSATATDTYARGDVTALDAVGGLVGTQTGTSLIKTSYSSGNVTATDIVVAGQGALVGEKTGGDIENSYALKDAGLGVNVGLNMVGSDGLILGLKDDTQMRKASTFDGFDFASIWEMLGDPENSVDYPVFQFQDLFSIYGRVLDTLNMNLPAETVNLASNGVIQAGVTTVSSAATDPNNNYALIFSEKDFVGDEAILLFLSSGVANTVFELYDDAGVIPSFNLDIKQGEVRAVSFADSINEPSNTLLSTAAINTLGYTVAGTDVTVDSGLAFHSLADTSFTVDGDITTTAANIQFDTIASVNSGKNLSTKAGDLLFNSDLTLNGNNVLSTSAVNVTFNNTASFDGSNTFNADGGNLHFAGVTNFVGGPNVITTTGGAIDFDSNVNLDNSINNFNTAGGDVTFGGPLANTGTSAVTIAAGTGDLIFTSGNPIGTALDPITLTVNSVNHVELPVGLFEVVKTQVASSVHLSEAGRFNDAMNLLKVGGTLDIANTYPGGEPFIIEADEGILLKLENPMLNVPIVDIQGDVNFLTDATLTSDTSFDVAGNLIFADGTQIVFNALNDNISFMDPATVNGPGDLTLNSDTPVDLFAQIGNVTRLNSIHFPGVLNVVGDSSVSAGTVLFDDAITNSTPVDLTVSAPASGGFIRFGGQVSSPGTPMTLAVPEGGTAHLYAPIYTPLSLHQVYVVNRFNTGRLTDAWAIMRTSADFTQPFGISRPGLSRIGLPYNPLYPYHLNEMDEKLKVFLVPNKIIYIHDELQSNLTYVPGPYNDVISGFIY